MPIRINCPTCGKKLQVPDTSAGQRVQCPGCQGVLNVPDTGIVEAETFGVAESGPPPYSVSPASETRTEGDTKACPMCGERIAAAAAKCRFCGEIFDPELREIERKKLQKGNPTDADMTGGDWVVAVLCSGIGCIAGIVWAIQGKPKGGKMIGVSILFAIMWGIIRVAIELARHQ